LKPWQKAIGAAAARAGRTIAKKEEGGGKKRSTKLQGYDGTRIDNGPSLRSNTEDQKKRAKKRVCRPKGGTTPRKDQPKAAKNPLKATEKKSGVGSKGKKKTPGKCRPGTGDF